MNTNEHYVYIYLDPRKEGKFSYSNVSFLLEPFYVGKGKGIRFKKHLTIKDKSYKTHKINKIIKSGLSPEIVFIRSGLEEVQANKLEMLLISTIGRLDKNDGPLLNLTNGGEGVAGFTPSEATKKKLSKALLGRPLSNETKNKMKGRQPWNKGISLTEEQRERLSPTMFKKGQIAYNRGIPMSTEKYEKCSETFFGKGHIPWNKGLEQNQNLGTTVTMSLLINPFILGAVGGAAALGIVLNAQTKVVHTTIPNTATWNTLTSWSIDFTVRGVGAATNKILAINDSSENNGNQIRLGFSGGEFLTLNAAGAATIYNTPTTPTAFKITLSYSSGTDVVTMTTKNLDDTGSVTGTTATVSKTAGWDWRTLILVLNDSVLLSQNSGANFRCDYFRVVLNGTNRLLWEFENNTNDSSAEAITGTALGTPGYEDTPSTSTLNNNLVAFWKLDEASNTARNDSISFNNLTDTGSSVAQIAGKIGNAASFDASDELTRADNAALSPAAITIAAWVYMDSLPAAGNYPSIVEKWTSGQRSYILIWNGNSQRFQFSISTDGTGQSDLTASTFGLPSAATWYFILASFDNAGNRRISVNNGTVDTGSGPGQRHFNSTAEIVLGRSRTSRNFPGRIDAVGLWSRQLTAGETTDLYNSGTGKEVPF